MPTTMCKYHCITAQWALAAATENEGRVTGTVATSQGQTLVLKN